MAVVAADLISPKGEIERTTFAGEDDTALTERMEAYITDGMERTTTITEPAERDRLVKAWAYHRAYEAAGQILAATLSGKMGDSSYYLLGQQLNFFLTRSAVKLAEFERGITPADTTSLTGTGTTFTPNEVNW